MAVTLRLAIGEGFSLVAVAVAGSSILFVLGLAAREPDILFLAWLDQGSNLILVEVESSSATLVSVAITVVVVLLMGELSHATELFGRHGFRGSLRLFLAQFSRLAMAGAGAAFLAVVGIAFSPVILVTSGQVLFVAALAIGAMLAIVIAGNADR